MASRRSYDIGDSINKCKKYVFVAVSVPIILSQLPIVVSVRYQIITVSVDLESGIHMWSRSYCQTLSKHFRSDKLFLLEQARRLKSQKACYGGILCFFFPPQVFSLLVSTQVLCQMTAFAVWRGIPIFSNPPTTQILFLCTAGVF